MIRKTLYAVALAVPIALGARVALAAVPFTNAALNGKYMFNVVGGTSGYNQEDIGEAITDSDVLLNDGSLALNGVLTFSGTGGVTAADLTLSYGDDTADQINCAPTGVTGTYHVNADGDGTITLSADDEACLDDDTISFTFVLSRNFSGDHQVNTQSFSTTDSPSDDTSVEGGCFIAPDHELSVGDATDFPEPVCLDGIAMAGIFHHQ